MISRSLGPEAGANIGIIFAFTNAAFVGLNLIGAADAIIQIMKHFGYSIFANPFDDIRLIGFSLLVLIALIPIISLKFEAKVSVMQKPKYDTTFYGNIKNHAVITKSEK